MPIFAGKHAFPQARPCSLEARGLVPLRSASPAAPEAKSLRLRRKHRQKPPPPRAPSSEDSDERQTVPVVWSLSERRHKPNARSGHVQSLVQNSSRRSVYPTVGDLLRRGDLLAARGSQALTVATSRAQWLRPVRRLPRDALRMSGEGRAAEVEETARPCERAQRRRQETTISVIARSLATSNAGAARRRAETRGAVRRPRWPLCSQ